VSLLKQYLFTDEGSPAITCLRDGHHWNPNQSPGLAGPIAVYGWTYSPTSGESYVNHALETVFRFNYYPGTTDVKATISVKFPNVSGVNRWLDLYVRMKDPDNAYAVRLRTNFGTPQMELYRVSGGTWTSINGPIAVALSDGVYYDLSAEAIGNTVKGYLDDVEKVSATETDANVLGGNERTGFGTENGQVPNGPVVKDHRVYDTADESGKTGEFILQVGAEVLGQAEMEAAGVSLDRVTMTHFGANALTIRVKEQHTNPRWVPEEWVKLKAEISGTPEVVFQGKIRTRQRLGTPPDEQVEYYAAGPRAHAKYVIVEHPTSKAPTIVWNALPDEEGYDLAYSGQTVGEILKWHLDQYRDDLAHHGAVNPDPAADIYVQADLDALTVEPTRMELGGDFESVVMSLLSTIPDVAVFVEPDTLRWRFVDVASFSAKDVAYDGTEHVQVDLEDDTANLYTAVLVRSVREEQEEFNPSTENGGLLRNWNRGLEKYWTPSKQDRSALYGLTLASIVDAGLASGQPILKFTLPAGSKMFTDEWVGAYGSFSTGSAAGTGGLVVTNTTDQVTIALAGGYPTGSPPVAPSNGDAFDLEDDRANENATGKNAFFSVHRNFQIADADKRDLVPSPCSVLRGGAENPTDSGEERWVAHQPVFGASPGAIVVGVPIIFTKEGGDKEGRCETEGDYAPGKAAFEGSYKMTQVREVRIPATGYRGTAFSDDVSKWNGGGDPVPGEDWGIERVALLSNNEWKDSSQDDGVEAAATAWLHAHQNKPYTGDARITGLDWDFKHLQKAVTFSTSNAQRGATGTGKLATDYIYPFEVAFILSGTRATNLILGDRGEFAKQFQDLMETKETESVMARLRVQAERLDGFQRCFEQSTEVKATKRDDNPTCATSVKGRYRPKAGGGKVPGNLKKKLDEIQDELAIIVWVLNQQKDIEEPPEDPATEDAPDAGEPGTVNTPRAVVTSRGSYHLWTMRPHGTLADEMMVCAPSAANAKVAKAGRDRGREWTGRGEPGMAEFHHRHVFESSFPMAVGGPGTNVIVLANTVLAQRFNVWIRDGAANVASLAKLDIDPAAGPEALLAADDRTITINIPVLNADAIAHVEYETQGDLVRRTETIHAEAGFEVEKTVSILAEAV